MADSRFVPSIEDIGDCLAHLVEEIGEAGAALGKTMRHGPDSVNPLLPTEQQERNGDWLLRELDDLEQAIRRARAAIIHSGFVPSYAGGGR